MNELGKIKQNSIVFLMVVILFILSIIFFVVPSFATDYVSSNFIIRDPVITVEGGRATSSSFIYFSSTGQTSVGSSTSTSFSAYDGFLYFTDISIPTLTATAGNAQASLSWSESTSTFGYVVTSYQVGQSTVSGGSYSYTDVGNVLSSTRSSLTNGTTYYFIIRVIDNQGDVIATSTESSVIPVASSVAPSGGGGGGGSSIDTVITAVKFSGMAYPLSKVTILKDGQIAVTTIAGPDAKFDVLLSGLSTGNYVFSVISEDDAQNRSSLFTFPIFISKGVTINVGGIFISPTINVDKEQVQQGENIAIFGKSVSNSEITILINSEHQFFEKVKTDNDGVYLYNFDTSPLELGEHYTKSKVVFKDQVSPFSKSVNFIVGNRTVLKNTKKLIGDLSNDFRVNIIDFSILVYWFDRFDYPQEFDLNSDNKIDLIDFSIMVYYWTG